jgi:amidase
VVPPFSGYCAHTILSTSQTPCGSSSGSAVGVAAGFAPVSLGTESDGSLVQPATRAGLYGLKATVGVVPTDGCQANSPMVATSGAMAKTVQDLADVLSIVMKVDFHSTNLNGSWDGIKLGFVNPDLWQPASFVVEPNESFKMQTVRLQLTS